MAKAEIQPLLGGSACGSLSCHRLGQASRRSSVGVFEGLAEKLAGVLRKLTDKTPNWVSERLVGVLPAGVLLKRLERCPLGRW